MTDTAILADPQNAADRLVVIVDRALRLDRTRTSADVWADVFGVHETNPLEKERRVADYLSAVAVQVHAIESALAGSGVPDPLHKNPISRTRNAFSVGALNSKWDDHAGRQLDAETRMALRWIAYVLPKEDAGASLEEVAKILELLDELDAQLVTDSLPTGLHKLLVKHAAEMRQAAKLFPIQGVSGLRRAVRSVLADVHIDQDEIRAAVQQGDPKKMGAAMDKFNAAFKKTAEVTGDLDKISKGTNVVISAISSGLQILGLPL